MFSRSHLALTLVFRLSGDLLDALSFLLGTMNWNLLLHTEFFLQVINTTACTWVRIQILHAQRLMLYCLDCAKLLMDPPSATGISLIVQLQDPEAITISFCYESIFMHFTSLMEHWIYSRQDSCFNLIFQLRWLDMKISFLYGKQQCTVAS